MSKRTPLIISVGILISVVILFHKYLFFNNLFLFTDIGTDTMNLFYPNFIDDARQLREGNLPFWSFSKGMGQGSWYAMILNPLNWILLILGEDYLAYGLGWVAFLKVILVSYLGYQLFKTQGLHRNAILLGAVLMAFFGYLIVGTTWYGHSSNILFMVMFLLGIELMIAKNNWWILAIAAVIIIGPPLFFIIEYAIIYGVLRYSISNKLNLPSIGQFFLRLWKPALAGLLLGAPFLGAMINTFINSPRVGGEASYVSELSNIGIFSMNDAPHLATIMARFLSNDLLGGPNSYTGWKNILESPTFYCGLISLILAPQLFVFLKKKQKVVFGVVLAILATTLVFPWFRNAFYLFQGEYYKGALSFFIPFTLIWMAVLSMHNISNNRKLNMPLLIGTIITLIICLFSIEIISNIVQVDSFVQFTVLAFLLIQGSILASFNFVNNKSIPVFLLLISAVTEGLVFSYSTVNDRTAIPTEAFQDRQYYNDYSVEALDYLRSEDPGFYRIEKLYGSFLSNGLNDSQAQNYFDTKTYRSHNHNSYIDFLSGLILLDPTNEETTRWIAGLWTAEDVHPLINLKYLLSKSGSSEKPSDSYYDNLGEINGINIYKSKYFLPFGIPFSNYILKSEIQPEYDYFRIVELMYNGVIIDDSDIEKYPNMTRYSANRVSGYLSLSRYHNAYKDKGMTITSFSQSHITGKIEITEPSVVYLSIPYDAGWKAIANGKSVPLNRVNFGMTGMYLEPGNYEIELRYRPPFITAGLLLFLIGLAGLIYFIYKSRNTHLPSLLPSLDFKPAEIPGNELVLNDDLTDEVQITEKTSERKEKYKKKRKKK